MHHHPKYARFPQARCVHIQSPIPYLPTELLLAVALLPERHDSYHYVVDVSSLVAFSLISRAMRNVILPSVYEQLHMHRATVLAGPNSRLRVSMEFRSVALLKPTFVDTRVLVVGNVSHSGILSNTPHSP
jgi:hypothetical protein